MCNINSNININVDINIINNVIIVMCMDNINVIILLLIY